jgi:hypothetical protein
MKAPAGLASPPKHAPRKLQTNEDLRALQRLMTHALVQPLVGADDRLAPRWRDGRPMREVAAEFIKPNDRLSSVDRLQIYARCYWYRLIDCVHSDCPALRALLGEGKFSALTRAYLAKYPSRSFTLRNLCERLPQFIREEPRWTAPHTALAQAIARFEWAQTVAFDAEARPRLTPDDIAGAPPAKLRLALQPYISLLASDWAIDDFAVAVKSREALRAEASNAVDRGPRPSPAKRVAPPARRRVYLLVHRHENRLYYKRLEPAAYRIFAALAVGRTLAQAVAQGGRRITPQQVQAWFALGMELGWFCRRK